METHLSSRSMQNYALYGAYLILIFLYLKAPPRHWDKGLFGHPLWWLELFNQQPRLQKNKSGFRDLSDLSKNFPYKFNTIGLSKLLMFGNYIRSKGADKADITVKEELNLYPYTKKEEYKEPYFTPVDLEGINIDFTPSITDAGICQVYNGDSIGSLFKETVRVNEFMSSLDPRSESVPPNMINGTGKISQKVFWLDASNKYMAAINSHKKYKGSLLLAINDWQTFYSVRLNQIDLRGGTEVIVKIQPVMHSTSENFRRLALEERECRYMDEQMVMPLGLVPQLDQ